jgi:hypothetical protein
VRTRKTAATIPISDIVINNVGPGATPVAIAGVTGQLTSPKTCGPSGDLCCMTVVNPTYNVQNKSGMVTSLSGMEFFPVFMTGQNPAPGNTNPSAPCTIDFTGGSLQPSSLIRLPGTFGVGAAQSVDVFTYFHEPSTNTIKRFNDQNLNGAFDDFEIITVASSIYDLQFAIAFDVNSDGVLNDAHSAGDEWLGNHSGDQTQSQADGNPNQPWLAGAQPSQMRMVEAAVVVGAVAPFKGAGTAQILNGTAHSMPRKSLRASSGRAMLRNVNIFQ